MSSERDELLQELWEACMDSHPRGVQAISTALMVLLRLNLIDKTNAEMWRLRAKHLCPEQLGHSGGRAWCAYCGDIDRPLDDEEDAA